MKAGGAYLILELAYPPPLLAEVVADASPRVVLTQERYAERLPEGTETFFLDEGWVEGLEDVPAGDDRPDRPGQPGLRLVLLRDDGEAEGYSQPAQGAGPLLPVALRYQRLCPRRQGGVQRLLYLGDDAAAAPRGYHGCHPRRRYLRSESPDPLSRRVRDHGDAGYPIPPRGRPQLERARCGREALETKDALAERRGRNPHARPASHGAVADARLLNVYSCSETHEVAAGDLRELVENPESTYCAIGVPMDPEHLYLLDSDGERVPEGESGSYSSAATVSLGATSTCPRRPKRASPKTPSPPRPEQGCTAPATGHASSPMGAWRSSAAWILWSRSGATASSSAPSRPPSRRASP